MVFDAVIRSRTVDFPEVHRPLATEIRLTQGYLPHTRIAGVEPARSPSSHRADVVAAAGISHRLSPKPGLKEICLRILPIAKGRLNRKLRNGDRGIEWRSCSAESQISEIVLDDLRL